MFVAKFVKVQGGVSGKRSSPISAIFGSAPSRIPVKRISHLSDSDFGNSGVVYCQSAICNFDVIDSG